MIRQATRGASRRDFDPQLPPTPTLELEVRDANTGTAIVGWTYGQSELQKDSVRAMFVSTNYFQTIGVTLFRGAGFSATSEPAVILGYRCWQNQFASDPDIIVRRW